MHHTPSPLLSRSQATIITTTIIQHFSSHFVSYCTSLTPTNMSSFHTEYNTTAQTDAAKALVKTVARAFYDDHTIVVVDFLLDAKFLRDGNSMGKPLHLSTKQVRHALAFLHKEHLVNQECVEGRVETSDQQRTYRRTVRANFWYLDLCQAVHTIKLRLAKIKKKFQEDVNKTDSTSTYQCPGYTTKRCNGLFTEEEVQHCPIDETTGEFLCQECYQVHKDNPESTIESYKLQLIDNTQARKDAEQKLARFERQMRAQEHLGPGIYQLVQKVDDITQSLQNRPVTSHLPSHNGAQEYLIGEVLHDTSNFNTEAAEEFSNAIYVTGLDGQRMVLELELGTGLQANYWAHQGAATPHRIRNNDASGKVLPKPVTQRTASLQALQPLPKPKRICRNTTPFFLKQGTNGGSEEGVDDLTKRTRQLSIELESLDEFKNNNNTTKNTFDKIQALQIPETDTCILWQSIDTVPDRASVQHLVQRVVKTQKTPRRSSSFPPPNLQPACTFTSMDATTLFNSVEWESAETNSNTNHNKGRMKESNEASTMNKDAQRTSNSNKGRSSSILQTYANVDAFNSMDMLESFLPNLQSMDMMAGGGGAGNSTASPISGSGKRTRRDSLAMLESLLPTLQSMDVFAAGMGNLFNSTDGGTSMKSMDQVHQAMHHNNLQNNNNNNNNNKRASADKKQLDSINLFKSTEYWEHAFATQDLAMDMMTWQQQPQPPTSQKPEPVAARSTSDAGILGSFRESFLASRDWIGDMQLDHVEMPYNSTFFQSHTSDNDKKLPAAPSQDKWMQMYQEGLDPANNNNVQGPAPVRATSSSLFPPLPDAMPPPLRATSSSLFPPLPDAMPPPLPITLFSNANGSSKSAKPKDKPAAATASKPKKKKPGNGQRRAEPVVKVFVEYTDHDVLCQRGTKSRLHPGNERYRQLVEHHKPEYRSLTDKFLKTKFAASLVQEIQGYGGRFLEKDKETGRWFIIADKLARSKAGQALRDDNTPEARQARRERYGGNRTSND